ncbi:MAG TPA: hypoxanthine phosphoribosyltransferase [Bacteroidales bacterium]|nr:hypoxanthine phosphoribosyltransferase [Bacteroidales bacterium]
MEKKVTILDKTFGLSISAEKISEAVNRLAQRLNDDMKNVKNEVVFLGILNGSFMFAADLFRRIDFPCRITFLKLASYSGTQSTGVVKSLIGINENLKNKIVIVLEDIVDSGETLENIICQLRGFEPADIKLVTFLFKPEAYKKVIKLDYVGMEIPNDFIVGYGLDYDGYGRNLPEIYSLIK